MDNATWLCFGHGTYFVSQNSARNFVLSSYHSLCLWQIFCLFIPSGMIQRETHTPRSQRLPGTISLRLPYLIICKSPCGSILSHRTDLLSHKRKRLPSFLDLLLQLRRFPAKPICKSSKCSTHGCRFRSTRRVKVRARCHLFACWIYGFLASATLLSGRLTRRSMA